MRRITISLPEDIAADVAREARRRGETVSALIRQLVEGSLRREASTARGLPFVGLGRSGHRHTARDAESILEREWDPGRRDRDR